MKTFFKTSYFSSNSYIDCEIWRVEFGGACICLEEDDVSARVSRCDGVRGDTSAILDSDRGMVRRNGAQETHMCIKMDLKHLFLPHDMWHLRIADTSRACSLACVECWCQTPQSSGKLQRMDGRGSGILSEQRAGERERERWALVRHSAPTMQREDWLCGCVSVSLFWALLSPQWPWHIIMSHLCFSHFMFGLSWLLSRINTSPAPICRALTMSREFATFLCLICFTGNSIQLADIDLSEINQSPRRHIWVRPFKECLPHSSLGARRAAWCCSVLREGQWHPPSLVPAPAPPSSVHYRVPPFSALSSVRNVVKSSPGHADAQGCRWSSAPALIGQRSPALVSHWSLQWSYFLLVLLQPLPLLV